MFEKLQKATTSLVMSGNMSLQPHGTTGEDFPYIWYLSVFQKSDKKVKVLLKSDKHNRYFT
jgi:hypothetical protein